MTGYTGQGGQTGRQQAGREDSRGQAGQDRHDVS